MRKSMGYRALIGLVVAALVAVLVTLAVLRLTNSTSSSVGPDAPSSTCHSDSCDSNYLNAISCAKPSFCVAVGYYRERSGTERTLIERWDGSSWAIMTSANTKYGKDKLASVSCSSARFCVAVGWDNVFEVGFTTIIEEWNGSMWQIVDPQPAVFAKLEGVQCFAATRCIAVGYQEKASSIPQTLVERWNGARWFAVSTANETSPDVMFNDLHGVSCATPSRCVAVGSAQTLDNDEFVEVEEERGTSWTLSRAPRLAGPVDSFAAVACPRVRVCFAVGSYDVVGASRNVRHVLIEEWNGTTWRKMKVPKPPLVNDVLTSITCESASFCVAVGVAHQDLGSDAIVDVWNGIVWRSEATPTSFASAAKPLNGVTCVDATDCYAVGWYEDRSGVALALVEHWNGSKWLGEAVPNEATGA